MTTYSQYNDPDLQTPYWLNGVYQFASGRQRRWWFGILGITTGEEGYIHPAEGTFPEDKDKFAAWLEKHGIAGVQEQLDRMEDLPWWIKWLADYKTTIFLAKVLAAELSVFVMAGLPAPMELTERVAYSAKVWKPVIIRNNLLRTLINSGKSNGGMIPEKTFQTVVKAYKPFVSGAYGLASWVRSNLALFA